jgi:hypothetical protein
VAGCLIVLAMSGGLFWTLRRRSARTPADDRAGDTAATEA